jgi:xanthine dehydrogenase YagT iron-sulfur-binding subunit
MTKAEVRATVNGRERELRVDPWRTLLDLLREDLDLTGTKLG